MSIGKRWWRRGRRQVPDPAAQMTVGELSDQAAKLGRILVPRAEWERSCADYAELAAELTDLDIELRVLTGDA